MANKIGETGVKAAFPKGAFSGLTFDVTKVKKSVVEDYPQLGELPSWKKMTKADADKIMRFIVLLVDPDTPLRKEKDSEKRRHFAAILSGATRIDSKLYKDLMALEDVTILEMIADYVSYICSRDWAMLIANEILFDRLVKSAMIDGISTAKAAPEEMEKVSNRIDTLHGKLFNDGKAAKGVRMVKITPELIAKRTSVQE